MKLFSEMVYQSAVEPEHSKGSAESDGLVSLTAGTASSAIAAPRQWSYTLGGSGDLV